MSQESSLQVPFVPLLPLLSQPSSLDPSKWQGVIFHSLKGEVIRKLGTETSHIIRQNLKKQGST